MCRTCSQLEVERLRCIRANLEVEQTGNYADIALNGSYLGLSMTAIAGPCQALESARLTEVCR
jgi:hypothetical protein